MDLKKDKGGLRREDEKSDVNRRGQNTRILGISTVAFHFTNKKTFESEGKNPIGKKGKS